MQDLPMLSLSDLEHKIRSTMKISIQEKPRNMEDFDRAIERLKSFRPMIEQLYQSGNPIGGQISICLDHFDTKEPQDE